MKIGNRFFDTKNHTYIMGILNVTPDSFSDGGKWNHMDEALKHTEAMIADGADIIDIGGESTRPGHTPVSADEEAQRVLPVIEAVKKHFDIPVSVDTFKSSVAESSIQAGADLVNDIWGLEYDPKMAAVIAKYDVACCLMHNKSNTEYQNFVIDMEERLSPIRFIRNRAATLADRHIAITTAYDNNSLDFSFIFRIFFNIIFSRRW